MLYTTALVTGATAIKNAITHFQLHSGARGSTGTLLAVGARVASTGTVDGSGNITWANIAFTGLGANQVIAQVSYWNALTSGTYQGGDVVTGDGAANSAGEYTITLISETASAA